MKMSPLVSPHLPRLALAVALAALLVPAARAVQFSEGELSGSFDTTLSFGGMYRISNPSADLYGTTNSFNGVPGLQNSVNSDDGNLNYGKGWVSELFKISEDAELKWQNFGAFGRAYYIKDFLADDTRRTKLSSIAHDRVVDRFEMLDLYFVGKFDLGDHPLDIRIGRQVLSLGESTFLPNGLNVVNPVDLARLRAPGVELKEALLPVNMVHVSFGLTKEITLEPFWLFEFRQNELEPAGTYFSNNDFASPGGQNVFLGFGTLPDNGTLGAIPRNPDREANNYNQYGVALRVESADGDHDVRLPFPHPVDDVTGLSRAIRILMGCPFLNGLRARRV